MVVLHNYSTIFRDAEVLNGSKYNQAYYVVGPGGGDGAWPVVGVGIGGCGARDALERKRSCQKTVLAESSLTGMKRGHKTS